MNEILAGIGLVFGMLGLIFLMAAGIWCVIHLLLGVIFGLSKNEDDDAY